MVLVAAVVCAAVVDIVLAVIFMGVVVNVVGVLLHYLM